MGFWSRRRADFNKRLYPWQLGKLHGYISCMAIGRPLGRLEEEEKQAFRSSYVSRRLSFFTCGSQADVEAILKSSVHFISHVAIGELAPLYINQMWSRVSTGDLAAVESSRGIASRCGDFAVYHGDEATGFHHARQHWLNLASFLHDDEATTSYCSLLE
ncbi:hypothetical protein Dimus_029990 [Dionaea muscipula]